MRVKFLFLMVVSVIGLIMVQRAFSDDVTDKLKYIKLPPGFHITLFAGKCCNPKGARSMALGDKGTLFVGTRNHTVYALVDADNGGVAEGIYTIAKGLNVPNGVAFKDGSLYVAEINRILRYDNIESRLKDPPKPVVICDKYPAKKLHGWKFIRFGPDGYLYVPIGAPCNICNPGDSFATITRMRPSWGGYEIFARGVRNTVGFDWDPVTKYLWFTDNGRDLMGENLPPDELNCAPRKGLNFGFPYWHGRKTPDPVYGKGHKASRFTLPELDLPAHVAPLGMRFYTGKMFPEKYRNGIFIAEHGSWNRSKKIGYRVTFVQMSKNRHPVRYEVFAQGWLQGEKEWGRPVDVQVMPDGSLLVSDDYASAIYRITYKK
jgi:glucose/arabinose dehydrogenase